jgi:hypothetical protein
MPEDKLTRQGVRDLGNNSRVRQPKFVVGCSHIWEDKIRFDCWDETTKHYQECGLCHEVRQ